jgi:hypothetical protein
MDETREKGLCLNCENKYSKWDKSSEKKLFYIDCEKEEYKELKPSKCIDIEETTPMKYSHALDRINTPQTLKLQGFIKSEKVTV